MGIKCDSLRSIQSLFFPDIGETQSDDSLQPIRSQVPPLQTTHFIESDMPIIDLVLHIGDISYATGSAGLVGEYKK